MLLKKRFTTSHPLTEMTGSTVKIKSITYRIDWHNRKIARRPPPPANPAPTFAR